MFSTPSVVSFWFLYFTILDRATRSVSRVKVGKLSIRFSSNFIHKIGITLRVLSSLCISKILCFTFLKVTSTTKRYLLKMCHLLHRLRFFLFRRKVMFRSQDIQVFVVLTVSWFTKSVTPWLVLVHETECIFEYIFWNTTH